MATINLGRIKPVFKGAYASGTAYVVDDIVVYSDESYICIQAGTGQTPSSATAYWTKMAAKGTNGTNGTDVGTVLTTQGDILYRDGSGLQRLPKGTAGQVLKMNSSANAPEYGTLSSDFVKIASVNQTSDVSGINFESFINNSTYSSYYMKVRGLRTSSHNTTVRMLTGTNTEYTTSNYRHTSHGRSDSQDGHSEENARWRFTAGYHANTGNDAKGAMLDFWLHADANTAATHNSQWCNPFYNSNSDRVTFNSSGGVNVTNQTWTGIRLYADGGTIHKAKVELYGLK